MYNLLSGSKLPKVKILATVRTNSSNFKFHPKTSDKLKKLVNNKVLKSNIHKSKAVKLELKFN